MKRLYLFLQLIRWPNLLFIALTQALFHYCILLSIFAPTAAGPAIRHQVVLLLMAASVLIAAGGYIINDYFDINIDRINKPQRQLVGKFIGRRWAIFWHSLLSFAGVVTSFYAGWKSGIWWIGFANAGCTFLLFVYSSTFKKRLLSGNIIISVLTAWSVAILGMSSFYLVFYQKEIYGTVPQARIFRFTILYAGFAFVISLIREAIKDMEDIRGDARYGCKTLPIVAGLVAAKTYVMVWLVVLIGALVIVQLYALQFNWWLLAVYAWTFIILPLVYLSVRLYKATTAREFHRLSTLTKLVMLTGILSMAFFKLYI